MYGVLLCPILGVLRYLPLCSIDLESTKRYRFLLYEEIVSVTKSNLDMVYGNVSELTT